MHAVKRVVDFAEVLFLGFACRSIDMFCFGSLFLISWNYLRIMTSFLLVSEWTQSSFEDLI